MCSSAARCGDVSVDWEPSIVSGLAQRRLAVIGAGLVLAIGLGTSLAAEAGAGAAETMRVSVNSHEAQAKKPPHAKSRTGSPAISAHGRFVAFTSEARNLIPRDTNRHADVFVRDRKRGTTRRVSLSSAGRQANRGSFAPAISADGRFVAFGSVATNLVSGDTNSREIGDIFVRDLKTARTERASLSSDGAQANGDSGLPAISANGRFVAFRSRATNLVEGPSEAHGIFVHDRRTGETERVSLNSAGGQANRSSFAPSISADGRFVAFGSNATTLVPGDTNESADVFVHDRATSMTTRVSASSAGDQGDGPSGDPSISADGRFVAFASLATNLVNGDTNRRVDIFVHDQRTGETTRIRANHTRRHERRRSAAPSISASGRFVAFYSRGDNLVAGDTNGSADVFVHDRRTRETRRVSVSSGRVQGDNPSRGPAISADGRFVAFTSKATNLVRWDTNREEDIFVRGPLR
jgi:Tol biopolymer transport system component